MAVNDNWLTDFVNWLGDKLELVPSEALFVAKIPEDYPASVLGTFVVPIPGNAPDRAGGFRYPRVQLVHRCSDFFAAWDVANQALKLLNGARPMRIGTAPNFTLITRLQALGEPYALGQDENQAWVVGCSYELHLQA